MLRPAAKATVRDETAPTLDRDALEALAWIESGMPDSKVGYGPDAPKLTAEQLAEFEAASYAKAPKPQPVLNALRKAAG